MFRTIQWIFSIALVTSTIPCRMANATEGAFPLYINGYQGPKAGYLPPPGVYFRNDVYHHPGHVNGTVLGGLVEARANVKISFYLLNLTYVTPLKLLGADIGCGVLLPIGRINVHATANVNVPRLAVQPGTAGIPQPTVVMNSISAKRHRVAHGIADTLAIPLMLGWHVDNLHLLAFQGLFLPTGKYTKGKIANMGQNHFATETDAGFTWLNPKWGTEISAITGVTVNFTNHKIHYRSGTGWHTEFFAGQYLPVPMGLELGLSGYWFYQLTPDSGRGTQVLGGFRGRVLGLGPCISYDFKICDVPMNANIRYYKEMHSRNYLKGESVYFTVNIPIP